MIIPDIETPATLLDKEAMERNIARMDALLAGTSMVLYPHYKSHKCPEIARMQMTHGAGGITCAKLGEAEDLIENGIPVVVIANQVVQPSKLKKLASLAKRADLTVCADAAENVRDLEAACAAEGSRLGILIEYEVGMRRCGVDSYEEALSLAVFIRQQPHLVFSGIQAYAGHLAHETDALKRKREMLAIEKEVAALKVFLESLGVPVRHICGGSTGTAADKPKDTVYTQLQAGSYLFMDASYARLGLVFEQAMFVASSVISVKNDRVVTDCGVKSLAMDQVPPYFADHPGAALSFSEEHTSLFLKNSGYRIGDRLLMVPGHCCTTNNCFEKIVLIKNGTAEHVWPIVSRGKAW